MNTTRNYIQWEADVTALVTEQLECSNGDAQGIIEVNELVLAQAWVNKVSVLETVNLIINS